MRPANQQPHRSQFVICHDWTIDRTPRDLAINARLRKIRYRMASITDFGLPALQRCFDGLELHEHSGPDDVTVNYHSYRGLLAYFVQTEHCIYAREADARECLRRLLKYNLTWGMLCPGMVFIPILALGNYFTQKRSITRQMRAKTTSSVSPDSK